MPHNYYDAGLIATVYGGFLGGCQVYGCPLYSSLYSYSLERAQTGELASIVRDCLA